MSLGQVDPVVVGLDLALPDSSTNETMTDSVSFGIRAEAVGDGSGQVSPPPVLGESDAGGDGTTRPDQGASLGESSAGVSDGTSNAAPGPTDAVPPVLPTTGAPVQLAQLLLGGALLMVGVALVRWGRRGRISRGSRALGE